MLTLIQMKKLLHACNNLQSLNFTAYIGRGYSLPSTATEHINPSPLTPSHNLTVTALTFKYQNGPINERCQSIDGRMAA